MNLIRYFKNSEKVKVALLVCNNPGAPVLQKTAGENVPVMILDRKEFFASEELTKFLQKEKIDLLVLAGFLWLLPEGLIRAFPKKIVNIHPALLPQYGGKGMYGRRVHESVLINKEARSGITIHYVNEVFDAGEIIFQEKIHVALGETPGSLAQRVQALEHEHYPRVIERLLT